MITPLLALSAPAVHAEPLPGEIEFAALHVVGRPPALASRRPYHALPDRLAVEAELAAMGLEFGDAEVVTGAAGGWQLAQVQGDYVSETKLALERKDSLLWSRLDQDGATVADARAGWYGHACADVEGELERLDLALYRGRAESSSSRVVLAEDEERTTVLATLAPGDSVMVVEAEGPRRKGSRVRLQRGRRSLDLQSTSSAIEACYHGLASR